MITVDLNQVDVRELNQRMHDSAGGDGETAWRIVGPDGRHCIAVGLNAPLSVGVEGHVGYYCAGDEPARGRHRERPCRTGSGREHDVRLGACHRQREPGGRCLGPTEGCW